MILDLIVYLLLQNNAKIRLIFCFYMFSNATKSISIIGCGWLGFPLAKFLLAQGYTVKGSTTQPEKTITLSASGIEAFVVQLNPTLNGNNISEFLHSDVLIVNIPPGRNSLVDDYLLKIINLNDAVNNSIIKKIIFISSTSVYPESNDWVDEATEIDKNSVNGLRMFNAEQVFRNNPNLQTTIIRMAGLIGTYRHPGRFFAGKQNIANGLAPVNLICLADCIGLISTVIERDFWHKTINGVAPSHPCKQDFYTLATMQLYGKRISFIPEKGKYKMVRSNVVSEELGYRFKVNDLMEWVSC
ncbi:MAG: SDR family NAD(P)-dependent oxidoreductase [Sphingobacteriales bacterium]|nr:MAG: SDR family NAD(P)-dependent oxidoreductase [Sphingobacteriales bacterium]TAF80855.1 MAG: SDR family NAD(P)-dependent oxidoreductase [Sphingobacteriales bacterium]